MKAWPEKTLSPQRGILHRDLKPSNVLIDQFDRPRVTDFGLAKRLNVGQASGLPPAAFQYATNVRSTVGEMLAKAGETPGLLSSDLTATGQVLGTPNYMVLLLAVAIGSPIGLTAKGHAILNGDQRMLIWDFQNNASHEVPMKNTVANRQVYAVSRSGKLSAWTSWLDLVQLWDNSAWKEIARLRNSVPVFGNGLCFLPDERTLAITCRDGEIVIWNWTSGSSKTFKTGLDEPLVITISADGKLLACEEAQSRIRVWSLPGGEEVAVLKGHRQYIHV